MLEYTCKFIAWKIERFDTLRAQNTQVWLPLATQEPEQCTVKQTQSVGSDPATGGQF